MKLKTGDTVVVITGKDRNKTGKIVKVLVDKNRVVVEGLNKVTKHVRKTKTKKGEKIQFEAAIHASNVMLVDPKTKKATRIGISKEGGKRVRIAKKSKTIL